MLQYSRFCYNIGAVAIFSLRFWYLLWFPCFVNTILFSFLELVCSCCSRLRCGSTGVVVCACGWCWLCCWCCCWCCVDVDVDLGACILLMLFGWLILLHGDCCCWWFLICKCWCFNPNAALLIFFYIFLLLLSLKSLLALLMVVVIFCC